MLGPAPHTFRSHLASLDPKPEYKATLNERYRILHDNKVPVVFTLMHLSVLAGVQYDYLRSIAMRLRANDYTVYPKRKRSGGTRWISVPSPQLAATQRWIASNILTSPGVLSRVHPAAKAYSRRSSIIKNAEAHAGAAWLIKIDIEGFFESISERQVYWAYRELGYPALLSFEMARISTRVIHSAPEQERRRDGQARWKKPTSEKNCPYQADIIGHLPQGAPTSPMLSNLVARHIDEAVQAIAEHNDGVYTRYADDLVLSFTTGPKSRLVGILSEVRTIIGKSGFTMNRKKTRVLGPGARKIVTGLLVNEASPRIPKDMRAHLDLALYQLEKRGIADCSNWERSKHPLSYLDHIGGLIQFAHTVEPTYAESLSRRLHAVLQREAELLDVLLTFGPEGQTKFTKMLS